MFKKAAVFGDIHFGKKSDSQQHNRDCADYIDWFCERAIEEQVDRIIFLGDWFHNMERIKLDTLHHANTAMDKLRQVAPVELIVGNHDMFYKQSREMHSLGMYKNWSNVTVHDEITVIDGMGFIPFLVGTEYLEVQKLQAKYLFGHFELPRFMTNSTHEFRDTGQFNADHMQNPEFVFSGHFHKRQLKENTHGVPIWYIGNCFAHDFNDVNDANRGMMILEHDGSPEFIDYPNAPVYLRFTTEQIIDMLEAGHEFRPQTVLEVKDNLDMDMDQVTELKAILLEMVRECRLIQQETVVEYEETETDLDTMTIDDVVEDKLRSIDPRDSGIQVDRLVHMFKEA